MIEVIVSDKRGIVARAEAPDPEAAILAADTLKREAREAHPIQGYARTLTAWFYVDGKLSCTTGPRYPF